MIHKLLLIVFVLGSLVVLLRPDYFNQVEARHHDKLIKHQMEPRMKNQKKSHQHITWHQCVSS